MSKQINIGGRLHSTEVGNVAVGANEVLDDTKGKKQNVINSETDAELLRLDQSKQNNLTFDNTPTENSTNPVTSGGVYAANITLHELIEAILVLIPSAASALNQLADKAFVNSSVSTATATFRGTYNVVTDLELAYDATHEQIATKLGQVIATADNNDYAFVQIPVSATSTDIRLTERYKFNGTVWGYEYDLNTSGFTAVQWEAINSGITALLVSKLTNLPTAEVLATMFNAKQNVLTFDAAPTALSTNPVFSGGVYAAIKAITDLIPSEATALNQLADKAYVLASILAATPAFKGQFTSLADLLVVASPKAGDLGIVRTKDSDGYDVFTFYQYLNNQWNVYFSLSYHPQTKPATTGITGDYPYNGMGRVELPMNIVEGVNTLTKSMMPTATGVNTIYVIQYDFTLGEDITIPANCTLQFEGGSISGAYTITGTNTGIQAGLVKIFNTNVTLSGTWNVVDIYSEWFGAKGDGTTDDTKALQNALDINTSFGQKNVFISSGIYLISSNNNYGLVPRANTSIIGLGKPTLKLADSICNIFSNMASFFARPEIVGSCDNVTIKGFILNSNSNNLQDPYDAGRTTDPDNFSYGVYICFSYNVTIEDCTFIHSYYGGFNLFGVDGQTVRNCKFSDIGIYECHFPGYAAFGSDSGESTWGVEVPISRNIIIENCYVDNCSYIYRINGGMTNNKYNPNRIQSNITLKNNIFNNCKSGIAFSYSLFSNVNICENIFYNVIARVLALSPNIVTSNVYTNIFSDINFIGNSIKISADAPTNNGTMFNIATTSIFNFIENDIIVEKDYLQGANFLAVDTCTKDSEPSYFEESYLNIKDNNFNLMAFDRFAIFSKNTNTSFCNNRFNMPNVRAHYILNDGNETASSLMFLGNILRIGGATFFNGSFNKQVVKNNIGINDI